MRDSCKSVSCVARLTAKEVGVWVYPHQEQKSAEATDSKRVDECPWCKRVRKR